MFDWVKFEFGGENIYFVEVVVVGIGCVDEKLFWFVGDVVENVGL